MDIKKIVIIRNGEPDEIIPVTGTEYTADVVGGVDLYVFTFADGGAGITSVPVLADDLGYSIPHDWQSVDMPAILRAETVEDLDAATTWDPCHINTDYDDEGNKYQYIQF